MTINRSTISGGVISVLLIGGLVGFGNNSEAVQSESVVTPAVALASTQLTRDELKDSIKYDTDDGIKEAISEQRETMTSQLFSDEYKLIKDQNIVAETIENARVKAAKELKANPIEPEVKKLEHEVEAEKEDAKVATAEKPIYSAEDTKPEEPTVVCDPDTQWISAELPAYCIDKPVQPEPAVAQAVNSSLMDRWFGDRTGADLVATCNTNANAQDMMSRFTDQDQKVIACATMVFENGSFDHLTRGVCNPMYQEGGDYRRCVYADVNSAGLDVGLIQINTYYQQDRIRRLSGITCGFSSMEASKYFTDPCNQEMYAWLTVPANNITIAVDIHAESGWQPWYGYLHYVAPYL